MPVTRINPAKVLQTGAPVPADAPADLVNGNVIANSEGLKLFVVNEGASAVTVTFKTSATVEGQAVSDLTASVPAGGSRVFGRFSRVLFGDQVEFTCSAAADVVAYA
ncbi:hypothetical protein [Streptomyces sp. NPDC006355]|uniref:hypothetical protein n=1 Tax=Streptomyces sp. NPDC006355 TaxID=3156758 RepID=UPI0033BF37D6